MLSIEREDLVGAGVGPLVLCITLYFAFTWSTDVSGDW